MKRIAIIEFLKGYAIFTIMVFHFLKVLDFPNPYNKFIYFGGTGVHLFVCLSGLGLYLSELNKPLRYGKFMRKRFTKVYTPYILIVLLSAFISLIIPIYDNSLYALGGHVFLFKMFDQSIIGSYGYPLWFISLILQFYIFFKALAWVAKRVKSIYFFLMGLGLSMVWVIVLIATGNELVRVWNSFFLQYLWEFVLGMIIASILFKNDNKINFTIKPVYVLFIGILSCGFYATLALKGGAVGNVVNDIPALIGYSSIAIWIYSLNIGWVNKFFRFTGEMSFSVYLLHALVLQVSLYFFREMSIIIALLIAMASTYLLSVYYQKLVNYFFKVLKL